MRLTRALTFTIAVIAALGSAIAVRRAIVATPQPPVATRTTTVDLLIAKRALSAGERIAASDLRWRSWPKDAVPDGAIIRNQGRSLGDFDKTYARYPVMAGEPVADAKLIRPGEGNHAASLIAPGKRAVAVPVREVSAAGGLVQPNDRVDVLWSGNSPGDTNAQPQAQTLLRGVRVIAIGGSLVSGIAQSGNDTATLELTQEQARIIAGARFGGEISLALIPLTDDLATTSLAETHDMNSAPAYVRVLKFGRGGTGLLERSAR